MTEPTDEAGAAERHLIEVTAQALSSWFPKAQMIPSRSVTADGRVSVTTVAGSSGQAHPEPPKSRVAKAESTTAPLLAVVHGAIAGIGSVYLTTHSIFVTLIAAILAIILGGFSLPGR